MASLFQILFFKVFEIATMKPSPGMKTTSVLTSSKTPKAITTQHINRTTTWET